MYKSHLAFFFEFATLFGIDIPSFGLPVAQGGYSSEKEETILALFAVFVWRNPRVGQRRGKKHNSGRHCQACVGAVRDWVYDEHRRTIAELSGPVGRLAPAGAPRGGGARS